MSFDNIRLEKGLYTTGKSFTKALEELDPSENYIGTELEGLDAYQRQLKRFDIKVSGRDADTVSKFFQTSDSAALFPEYVSRAVNQGIELNDSVEKLIAATTEINALDYRAVQTVSDDDALGLKDVAEGAFIPETHIQLKDTLTPLKKRGRMLVASYEAIKFQSLDLFTVMLSQIGMAISKAQFDDLIESLTGGTGVQTVDRSSETVSYAHLVELWNEFSPYSMNSLIASGGIITSLLNMSEFKDSNAGLNFHATGNMITPLGAQIIKSPSTDLGGTIIGLDNRYAVEKVQAGGVMTDFDKLIDRQLERATITAITGFSRICDDAVKILDTKV